MIDLTRYIRDVPDFPKPGIVFKDITPLLADHQALRETTRQLVEPFRDKGVEVVAAVESRGFIFGALAACELQAALVPIRKPGKLPFKTVSQSYSLEYGVDTIEVHEDAIRRGQRVLMVDDVLATGGTMDAACRLVRRLGGEILAAAFVIELAFLPGRERIGDCPIHSLIQVR